MVLGVVCGGLLLLRRLRWLVWHTDLGGGRGEPAVVVAAEAARLLRVHAVHLAWRYVRWMRVRVAKMRRGAE